MAGTSRNNRKKNEHKPDITFPGVLSLLNNIEKLELEHSTLEIGDLEFWIPTNPIAEKRLIIVLAKMVKHYLHTHPEELEGYTNTSDAGPASMETECEEKK